MASRKDRYVTNRPDPADELVDLEERFWLQGGGNPDFWRTHFAEEGVVALPLGIMDKNETMEAMERAAPWARVDMDDLRVVPFSDAAALVTYRATATRVADEEEFEAVIGSVYVKRNGAWLLMFHQQSFPMEHPDA